MQQCIVAILFYLQVYNYVQSSNTFHRQDSLICSSHCIIITRGSSICVTCRSVYNQDQNGIKRSTFFFRSWPRDQDGLWLTNVNGPAYLLIKILRRHGNIFFFVLLNPRKIKWSRVLEGSDQSNQRQYSLFKIIDPLLRAICARYI